MSLLTKLFVILLVVLSIAFVSGTLVALNGVELNKESVDKAIKAQQAAQAKAGNLENQLAALTAIVNDTKTQAANQIESANNRAISIQNQLNDSKAQLAQASQASSLLQADGVRLTEALKSSEDTKSKYADQIADLRKTNGDLLSQNGDLNKTVTEQQSRIDVTERERKFLAEQLAEAKNTSDKQSKALKDAGINVDLASAGTKTGAPKIDAVIRDTRVIAGIPYATISVGANAQVTKGMEFSLVSREGDFLGKLTVDSVEADEATGRVSGPRTSDVHAGVEAKTQL